MWISFCKGVAPEEIENCCITVQLMNKYNEK
jgi:hypothetical protein